MVSRFAETNTQMDSIMSQIQDKLAIARHSGKDIEVKVGEDRSALDGPVRAVAPVQPPPGAAAQLCRCRTPVPPLRLQGERESLKRLAGQGEDQPTEVNRGPRGWDWGQPSKVDSQTTIYENASIVEKNNTTPPPPPPPIKAG
ncbi:unnamed protein product, partial [Mesorhabditis spiculigera]